MAQANRSVSHYWVDVILTTAWECRRFDCEREALAYAQVYAGLPNACAVVAYAYRPEGREIIFDWCEAERASQARQSCLTARTT
jgi:hypothetical protein